MRKNTSQFVNIIHDALGVCVKGPMDREEFAVPCHLTVPLFPSAAKDARYKVGEMQYIIHNGYPLAQYFGLRRTSWDCTRRRARQ